MVLPPRRSMYVTREAAEMGERKRRRRVESTDDWERLQLLCRWPEQLAYEELRPLVLFRLPVAERAGETGSSERTLYRRISRFEDLALLAFAPDGLQKGPTLGSGDSVDSSPVMVGSRSPRDRGGRGVRG
jgi:hypothetical protein